MTTEIYKLMVNHSQQDAYVTVDDDVSHINNCGFSDWSEMKWGTKAEMDTALNDYYDTIDNPVPPEEIKQYLIRAKLFNQQTKHRMGL